MSHTIWFAPFGGWRGLKGLEGAGWHKCSRHHCHGDCIQENSSDNSRQEWGRQEGFVRNSCSLHFLWVIFFYFEGIQKLCGHQKWSKYGKWYAKNSWKWSLKNWNCVQVVCEHPTFSNVMMHLAELPHLFLFSFH